MGAEIIGSLSTDVLSHGHQPEVYMYVRAGLLDVLMPK